MNYYHLLSHPDLEKAAMARALMGAGRFAKSLANPAMVGMRASNPGVYSRSLSGAFNAAKGGQWTGGYHSVQGQLGKVTKNLKDDGQWLGSQLRGEMQPGGIPTIQMRAPGVSPPTLPGSAARHAERNAFLNNEGPAPAWSTSAGAPRPPDVEIALKAPAGWADTMRAKLGPSPGAASQPGAVTGAKPGLFFKGSPDMR